MNVFITLWYQQRRTPLSRRPTPTPLDIVLDIENQRMRLGIRHRKTLAKMAGINAEMYSYLIRRGVEGRDLPVNCLNKVLRALERKRAKS